MERTNNKRKKSTKQTNKCHVKRKFVTPAAKKKYSFVLMKRNRWGEEEPQKSARLRETIDFFLNSLQKSQVKN